MSRKEWLKAISFISIFLVVLLGVTYVVRTSGSVKDRFAGFYAEEKNTIDVMMYGGSTVGTSFAPGYLWGEYGIRSYPLSSNTQRPKAIKYLMEETYKYQNPEVIVIELRMFTYDDEMMKKDEAHIREVTDNMKYSLQRFKTVAGMTDGILNFEEKLSYYFDIIKYHSNWGLFFSKENLQRVNYTRLSMEKGFESNEEILYYDENKKYYDKTDTRIPIPKEQEKELLELLQLLEERGQKAVFVVTPSVYDNDYYGQMNYMKDIIEAKGFQYLNLHEKTNIDSSIDYYDGGHTNVLGAKKCTDVLGEYLVEEYSLKKKSTIATDSSWNEAYHLFLESYKRMIQYKDELINNN